MATTPEWALGLDWQCRGCTATYPSQWARDQREREREHDEDDRAVRRS